MNKRPVSYMQTDPRWKSLPYRVPGESATIGGSGCGPTCAAMLIETLTRKTCTPPMTCGWSMDHGYKALNQGTYYSYFVPQFKAHGIDCKRLNSANLYGKPDSPVHAEALCLLSEGWYLIACMGKGLWTKSGHYVVVWSGNERYMNINDPASRRTDRICGDYETFRKQVKYYWAVDARSFNNEEDITDMTEKELRNLIRDEYNKMMVEQAEKPASSWAEAKLAEAKKAGITDGTRPQANATREQVAMMVLAAMNKE